MYFNRTEQRSLVLVAGLVLLGAAARIGFGPGPDDFSWTPAEGSTRQEATSLGQTRDQVSRGAAEEARASTPLGAGERLDPNEAPEVELRRLPGIGPSRASAIVRERSSRGPFRSVEDLLRVPGIGRKTLEKLARHLELAPTAGITRPLDGDGGTPVNVNQAQIKELEQITGIGPVLAARIVATRHRMGPFRGPEDLLRVPGIGPSILRDIQGQVRY